MEMGHIFEYLTAAAMAMAAFFCKFLGYDEEQTKEVYENIESMLNGIFGYEPEA